jgi:hypothetical protein
MQFQGAQSLQPPWGGKPSPRHAAQACVDHLTYLTPGGWRLEDYVCTAEQVSYTWSRNQSTLAYLREQVPGAKFELNGEKATYSVPLKLERTDAEAILDQKELLEPIVSSMQLMGVATQITSVALNTPGGDGPRPAWRTFAYKLNTRGLAPMTVAAALEKPGVRIDKLTYRGGEWSIEGMMYVK